MTHNIPTNEELFENGHPCEYCITKATCKRYKGLDDHFVCDLPERYGFWKKYKTIEHLVKSAKNGQKDSIETLANLAKEMLENDEQKRIDGREYGKKIEKLLAKCNKNLK